MAMTEANGDETMKNRGFSHRKNPGMDDLY